MSRGTSKFLKSVPTKVERESTAPVLADHCEVRDCDSLYVGKNKQGYEVHKCGKADVYVNDFGGVKRGICAAHYIKGLVAAGKHSNQDLVDYEGRIDGSKVQELQENLARTGKDYAVHLRVVRA
jgi:hypothetical protein